MRGSSAAWWYVSLGRASPQRRPPGFRLWRVVRRATIARGCASTRFAPSAPRPGARTDTTFTLMNDMRRPLALLLLSLSLGPLACADRSAPTEAAVAAPGPGLTIADAARGFTAGFYWLPPLVKAPALGTGTFDPAASPAVEICELAGAACGPVLATYTMTSGPGRETVRLDEDS